MEYKIGLDGLIYPPTDGRIVDKAEVTQSALLAIVERLEALVEETKKLRMGVVR